MKDRTYKLVYWAGYVKHIVELPFKNYNEAYRWLYSNGYLPLTVSFIGWKN